MVIVITGLALMVVETAEKGSVRMIFELQLCNEFVPTSLMSLFTG